MLEAREDDVEKFRMVEKDIHKIEQRILDVEMNLNLPDDFNVDFAEIDFPDSLSDSHIVTDSSKEVSDVFLLLMVIPNVAVSEPLSTVQE